MPYTEVNINLDPFDEVAKDILQAMLGEVGYESFEDHKKGFKAYIPSEQYSIDGLKRVINQQFIQVDIEHTSREIEDQNWNETWEKNYFKPIVVGDQLLIRSSFHITDIHCKYEILIDPKMSFGTGHHSTTWLVAERMTRVDFNDKKVLDMGCGTGILAILANMKGASKTVGIDIDEWAYKNCIENIQLNKQNEIEVRQGGAEKIEDEHFDVILANINRNILLNDMSSYSNSLIKKGTILFSGFYTEDLPVIKASAEKNGLSFVSFAEKNNWVVAEFIKSI